MTETDHATARASRLKLSAIDLRGQYDGNQRVVVLKQDRQHRSQPFRRYVDLSPKIPHLEKGLHGANVRVTRKNSLTSPAPIV